MTLFFQQLGVWEAPAKVTPIGARWRLEKLPGRQRLMLGCATTGAECSGVSR
jgi:hypothetical protein